MLDVSRPARAMATSGGPCPMLAYHREWKPSASARRACSTILSAVAAPPVSPIRMRAPPLGGLGVEPEGAGVGEVTAVAGALEVPLAPERLRLQERGVGGEQPLDGRPAHGDPPPAVPTLQPVEVAAAEDRGRAPVGAQEPAEHVALAVGDVTVDLARVGREVVQRGLGR